MPQALQAGRRAHFPKFCLMAPALERRENVPFVTLEDALSESTQV